MMIFSTMKLAEYKVHTEGQAEYSDNLAEALDWYLTAVDKGIAAELEAVYTLAIFDPEKVKEFTQ